MFDRKTGIGATDARRIMEGEWRSLWMEKTGRREPEDLSRVFKVQLGKHTEPFHLAWIIQTLGIEGIIYDGHDDPRCRLFHPDMRWLYLSRDGWDVDAQTHIEVKHSGTHKNTQDLARYYMPQLQHGMLVTGRPWCWFSVIHGNEEPKPVPVEADREYQAQLLDLEKQFWWHVTEDREPDDLDVPFGQITSAVARGEAILVDGMTAPVDMSTSNEWAVLAAEFRELKPKADRCEKVNKELKALVPATASQAFGHGVTVSRTKKGLTLTVGKG